MKRSWMNLKFEMERDEDANELSISPNWELRCMKGV